MPNNSICRIDRALSGPTTPGQNRPESKSNEEVLHITHQIVLCHIQGTRSSGEVLSLCRDAVSVV